MTPWILIGSHLGCVIGGVVGGRWLTVRTLRSILVTEERGVSANDLRPPRSFWIAVVFLVAGLMVVGIGVQAQLAAKDNVERDRADRAYSHCLTRFAAHLVDSIAVGRQATARLDAARQRRDRAVDQVILTVVLARRSPPQATDADFGRALERFARSRARLLQVQRAVARTRADNVVASPEATCRR